jgi:signal transduction histidine kinase
LGRDNLVALILPWLAAAVVYDQLNFWILMGIVRLKEGPELDVLSIWRQTKWAMLINITVLAVGGGILAFAVERFDWIGIAIFFLPIALSSYAFQVYVRQMQAHMNNLEAIVEERTQELAQLMKEKDAFLAVLTHDMKSPLASIRLSSDVLANYPQAVDKRPHLLRAIINSERALTDIVNNILDLEKLRAGGELPLEKRNLDLVNLMSETVQIIHVEAQQKDINLSFETNREQMFVMGDSEQLRRALLNLLSNAVKYTPQHGRVDVEVHQNGEGAEILVQDTGYGIPKEELSHIFDRYHRVPGHVKLAAGTGLGLAIARAVVQAHGGDIMVESEEGKGSLFKVKLPLVS